MKQDRVIKLISLVLFSAVLVYMGANILMAALYPFQTAYAVEMEMYDSATVHAYTVREETVMYSNSQIITVSREEGEKVGVGQTVATTYRDENAEARQREISELQYRLDLLQNAVSGSSTDAGKLDEQIHTIIRNLSADIEDRSLTGISDDSGRLKSLVFTRGYLYSDTQALENEIDQVEAQLEALEALSSEESAAVTAPVSGVFSSNVDGYETVITPEIIDSFTVAQLEALQPLEELADNSLGKLITSSRWYLITAMEQEQALRLGSNVTVQFSESITADMEVYRVGLSEKGICPVVLSCDEKLAETTAYRSANVDIIFDIYEGLRMPKRALRMDDQGNTYVFTVEAGNAKLKYVDIISEAGEYYLVRRDPSSTDNLWPGDEIVVAGRNLYDGKVIS